MSYPIPIPPSAYTVVPKEDYNVIFNVINEVIGIGEDGYGLQDFFSLPVSDTSVIRTKQWNNLYIDLAETIYQHITGSSALSRVSTSTNIAAAYHNLVYDTAQYVLANRFTCHESQYYRDPITGVNIYTQEGTSRRTLQWGATQNQITQITKVKWPTRLLCRYFFNGGGLLTWTPFHTNASATGNPLGALDAEWAQFIRSIQIAQESAPLIYNRDAYINQSAGSTLTLYPVGSTASGLDYTYESNTLSINVEVTKSINEAEVTFTIIFANSDSETLVVVPTVGYWNEVV